MADTPYLVALALLERGGQRALPLTGKSQSPKATPSEDPGVEGQTLALELLLRLWQQSGENPIRRLDTEGGLLLVELPMEVMQERLPLLKAAWLKKGNPSGPCGSPLVLAARCAKPVTESKNTAKDAD